jgi:hypothetical protein
MPEPADIPQKIAETVVTGAVGGPVGTVAKAVTFVLKLVDGAHERSIRDKAREKLNCPHIVVCPHETFNTRQTDMIDYVKASMGMAFVYESVALGHHSSDFNVKPISTQTIRYCKGEDGKASWTDSPAKNVMSCGRCMLDRVGNYLPPK